MKPEYIILHHSLTRDSKTVSWGAIRRYHTKTLGWNDIGYHFGIELIGNHYQILTGRMMNEAGAHCRENAMNRRSLGVCFVGDFDLDPPTKAQWDLGIKIVDCLQEVFGIPRNQIFGHRDFATHKTCPGAAFNIGDFRAQLWR